MTSERAIKLPSYRLHRNSGQAVVTLSGRDFYLGPHGTRISRLEYDRLVGEWLANSRALPRSMAPAGAATSISVTELVRSYWQFAKTYYIKDGRLGRGLGTALSQLITIVTYRTFQRWVAGDKAGRGPSRRGRPRTEQEIRELIVRLAEENGWGYTRILGELRKLGIHKLCRSTVINILKEHGLDPGPQRGEGSWDEFLKIHAATLWACDFLSKKVWTKWGLKDVFILFFVHVGTRRVFVIGMTQHPGSEWVVQQARNFSIHLAEQGQAASYLIHDRDAKFTAQFDALVEADGTIVKKATVRSPNSPYR